MPGIILTGQENVETTNTPIYQDWNFQPSQITINYYQGQSMPSPIVVACMFKDIIGAPYVENLTNLSYKTYVTGPSGIPACVALSGPLYTGPEVYAPINQNGIQGDMTYTFQYLNLLSPGTYTITAHHQLFGQNASGAYVPVDYRNVYVKIRVFPAEAPVVSPSQIGYTFIIGQTNSESTQFTITGPNWIVQCPSGFSFSQPAGVSITQLAGGGFEAGGTGTKTFTLYANPVLVSAWQNNPSENSNPQHFSLIVNGGILEVPISVTYLTSAGIFVSQNTMNFVSYKGVQDDPGDFVTIYHTSYGINFYLPPWLTAASSATVLNSYLFKPISSDNLLPGFYQGNVLIRRVGLGTVLGSIAVYFRVYEMLVFPYNENEFCFTLDRVFIEFLGSSDNIYYVMTLNARVYNFYSTSYEDISLDFKIPLYDKKQLFNIGLIVDRIMKRLPDFVQHNNLPYHFAEVDLVINQRKHDDAQFVQTLEIDGLKFVAGLKPKLVQGSGFLDINPLARRVTASGRAYLNMIVAGQHFLKLFKNGVELEGQAMALTQGVNSIEINFEQLNAEKGDVFEYRITTNLINLYVSKQFKVFPDGLYSNHILWEDEYKLKQIFEFTGAYQIKSEFDNRTQSLNRNLIEELEKIESTKVTRISINTGFILKTDRDTIESLMRSKKACVIVGGKYINMVAISKSIINSDVDEQLISYDVEFEINRAYNEEIHSF